MNADGGAISLIYSRGKLDEATVVIVAETHDLSLTRVQTRVSVRSQLFCVLMAQQSRSRSDLHPRDQ